MYCTTTTDYVIPEARQPHRAARHIFFVSVSIQIIINLSLLRLDVDGGRFSASSCSAPPVFFPFHFYFFFFVALVKYAKNAGKTRLEKRPNTKRELKFIAKRVKQII